jgi:ketosteroid isomerase-like protein
MRERPERSREPNPDDEPRLSDAERQAIAEIARDLEREFLGAQAGGPAERGRLDERRRPLPGGAEVRHTPTGWARRRPRRPSWARGFLLGVLVGAAAGGATATLLLMALDAGLVTLPSAARGAAGGGRLPEPSAAVIDPPAEAERRRALAETFAGWLAATRRGDVEAQMAFYAPRLNAYGLDRDVPAARVRADKARLYDEAEMISIEAGPAEIRLEPGGERAVIRYRKRYAVSGPRVRRRGEVVQELTWIRTGEGWRIVGERDVRVLSRE